MMGKLHMIDNDIAPSKEQWQIKVYSGLGWDSLQKMKCYKG